MRYETETYTVRYKVFDVGELVMSTSPRCSLEMGKIYRITRYKHPMYPGDSPIIFVEGRETGFLADYVEPAYLPVLND
jgi:hypothetical protein